MMNMGGAFNTNEIKAMCIRGSPWSQSQRKDNFESLDLDGTEY
jgi:hypothetical protein